MRTASLTTIFLIFDLTISGAILETRIPNQGRERLWPHLMTQSVRMLQREVRITGEYSEND
jgi:hypothetical protein